MLAANLNNNEAEDWPKNSSQTEMNEKSGAFFMTDSQGNKFSWRKKKIIWRIANCHIYKVKQLCPLRGGVLINVGEAC